MPSLQPVTQTNLAFLEPLIEAFADALEIAAVSIGQTEKQPVLVALEGEDEIVGCVWSTAAPPFDLDIGVKAEFRNQGLSLQLLAAWMKLPPQGGLERIPLNICVTNPAMKRILEFATLRDDGAGNYAGEVEAARLLTFLELTPEELSPGLVLWLHPSNLSYLGAHCECLTPKQMAQKRHPFVCVDVQGGNYLWMPTYSGNGAGRYLIPDAKKSGVPRQGDSWLTDPTYYHPGQVWSCTMTMVRGSLSGERTTPGTRNRVSAEIAAEMLKRARLVLKNPAILGHPT